VPDITQTLQDADLGFLKFVASSWDIHDLPDDSESVLAALQIKASDAETVQDLSAGLPPEAQSALRALIQKRGRVSATIFERTYGEIRTMGVGRREREHPELNPVSVAEILWYRGWIGRAFLGGGGRPEDTIYLPDEIYAALTDLEGEEPTAAPSYSSQSQESRIWFYRDGVLEQACTVLAALRSGEAVEDLPPRRGAVPTPVLVSWLRCLKCLDDQNHIQPEAIRRFLESTRPQALYILIQAWRGSMEFNELRMLRGLEFEGTWENDPAETREKVITLVNTLAGDDWMDLAEFVNAAKKADPDFQRSGGDYDAWFIREGRTGEYIQGFDGWDRVEGALLRFYITGLLYWLGLVELTRPTPGIVRFRLSPWWPAVNGDMEIIEAKDNSTPLQINRSGEILAPPRFNLATRYQIARFAQPVEFQGKGYLYRISAAGLATAQEQGLTPTMLERMLHKYSRGAIPPNVRNALHSWEQTGSQARIGEVNMLRVNDPQVMRRLKESSAARYLGESFGPNAVEIKHGAEDKLRQILAEMGLIL
jgi:hypothetical protein